MTMPTGLFIDAPEMEDASMTQLGNDVNMWSEEIIQKLKERVPSVQGKSTIVKFMKQDEETGTATGSILVSDTKKKCVIPVIIKEFSMYPLDVMMCENKLVPLTKDFFDEYFANNEVYSKLEEYPTFGGLGRFEDGNLWNATYPPSLGRYAYASAEVYPITSEIHSTVDGTEFRKHFEQFPQDYLGFKKHGHTDLIKKLAHLQPVNMNEFGQAARNLLNRNIVMLRREGANKYTILSNSDKIFSPIIQPVSRDQCYEMISKIDDHVHDTMNEVDQNGEKVLSYETHDNPVLAQPVDETIEKADCFDHYQVRDRSGAAIEGFVIPKVISFDNKMLDLKVFIGKTMSTIQPEIAGVRVRNSSFKIPFAPAMPGQNGVFVYMPDEARGLCTMPVTVVSVTDMLGEQQLMVQDLLGVGFKVIMSNSDMYKSITPKGDGTYILPKGFRFVPMEGFGRISNSPEDYAALGMGQVKSASYSSLISTGYGQFAFKGVKKYAEALKWDSSNLESYQVKFLLASLGMGSEKIAESIKTASIKGKVDINHLNYIPLESEKIAAARPTARKMIKVAEGLRANLIKVASFMENSQTVDAMLSLNFVNPDNITKFVGKIPSLKAAVSNLASCIIASRLGIQEIPEQAASTAMHRMLEVINGLEGLKAQEEVK